MRACVVVLSLMFTMTNSQGSAKAVQFPGTHNAAILQNFPKLTNLKDYVVSTPVIAPDVVINQYTPPAGRNITEMLQNHLKNATITFNALSLSNRTQANAAAIQLPLAPSQKRKREVPENVDSEATAELYRQTLEFLDKYDVELRYD